MRDYYRNNITCGANIKELKDQSAIKRNLSQKNAFLVAKQGLMGIRPNKTNFGLSFWHFWEQKREEERRREKEEERYGTRILYGNHVFVWIQDFKYGNFEYGSVFMDISDSISRV